MFLLQQLWLFQMLANEINRGDKLIFISPCKTSKKLYLVGECVYATGKTISYGYRVFVEVEDRVMGCTAHIPLRYFAKGELND